MKTMMLSALIGVIGIGIDLARLEQAAGSISAWANWPVNDDVAAQARTNGVVVRAFAPEADRRS
jgi:hypothetical protein